MGKGTKRTKGKTLALGDFIGETGSGNTVNVGGKAVDLPTAPRASTLEIDISKLPPRPPYTAVVTNLAYDITEEDLFKFFDGIEVEGIDIPRDDDMGDKRFKGVAYVTVNGPHAVDSLAHLLGRSDHMVLNRKCKIEIYQERGGRFGDRGKGRGMDDPGFGRSEAGDWRRDTAPASDDRDRRGGFDDRRDDRRGGYDDRDRRGGYDDRRGGGGGYDRYDRGGDRYDDRRGGGYDDRRGGGGYDDRRGGGYDRDDRRGGGFGGSAADDDSSWRRSAPEIPERRDIRDEPERRERRDEPRDDRRNERPRLQLQKRTVPESADTGSDTKPAPKPAPKAPSSIFGAAKPIDTSQKEKEIEEKLNKISIKENDHRDDRDRDRRPYRRDEPRREEYRREEKDQITSDERAHMAEEELKKRVEMGIDDARPECDRENVVLASRFAALDEDE